MGETSWTLDERRAHQREWRARMAELWPDLHQLLLEEPRCRGCGCSEHLSCPGGCSWAAPALCSACAADPAVAGALLEQLEATERTLLGVAVFAARVRRDTDGMWPPAARATECWRGLGTIEAECRRVHAAVTANEEGRTG